MWSMCANFVTVRQVIANTHTRVFQLTETPRTVSTQGKSIMDVQGLHGVKSPLIPSTALHLTSAKLGLSTHREREAPGT